jgi:CRP-like cAMP-binding protein
MDKYLLSLKEFLQKSGNFTDPEMENFLEIWKPFEAGRKQQLTSVGQNEKYLYFIVSGVQRVFYLDDQLREATLVFTYPPSFGGVLDSFLLQKPSKFFYETLSPSSFLRASFTDLSRIRNESRAIDDYVQNGVYNAFSGIMERLVEVQSFSAEDKFRNLLKRSPHILQHIPHKYLANYIGIDATNFSKLINRIQI